MFAYPIQLLKQRKKRLCCEAKPLVSPHTQLDLNIKSFLLDFCRNPISALLSRHVNEEFHLTRFRSVGAKTSQMIKDPLVGIRRFAHFHLEQLSDRDYRKLTVSLTFGLRRNTIIPPHGTTHKKNPATIAM